jgi:hypothetical protein
VNTKVDGGEARKEGCQNFRGRSAGLGGGIGLPCGIDVES